MGRHRYLTLSVLSTCIFPCGETRSFGQELPVQLQDGYRVVASASIGGMSGIAVMIDTGADCSVVDRKLVKRLKLGTVPESIQFNALGQVRSARRAILRGLRLGPIFTTIPCLVADIPYGGVDVILGLDQLRRYPFTVDFEGKKLVFGAEAALNEEVSFDPALPLIIIPIIIGGDVFRVMIDTGADGLYLFRSRVQGWILANSVSSGMTSTHVAGKSKIRETRLERVEIGGSVWRGLQALIVDDFGTAACDGAVGMNVLGLKQVHFDFRRGILSFSR